MLTDRNISLNRQEQRLQEEFQQQQIQQSQMVNQYLPALTTIYQQLSYAPAIYVQNVQVSSQAAAAAAAMLAPQQQIPNQYVTAAFCNPTTLHHFGQAIQQFLSPGSQYTLGGTFPTIPAQMIPQTAQMIPQAVFQPQPQMMFNNPAVAAQLCYQMQQRAPSRSRSPLP